MFSPLLKGFTNFPKEGALVGRILAAYGELEIDIMNCVGIVTKLNDINDALKGMYGKRGETKRLDNAEQLGLPHYTKRGLGTEFSSAIDAARKCLEIRNLYSHCQWHDDNSGELAFVNLEELASRQAHVYAISDAKMYHVTVRFLQDQEAYLHETSRFLQWLNYEYRFLGGEFPTRLVARPAQRPPPPLHKP
jgi:hypothetical protein